MAICTSYVTKRESLQKLSIQDSGCWPTYLEETTFTNRDGTRKVGRFHVKLMDGVQEDFKRSTVNSWKTKAANLKGLGEASLWLSVWGPGCDTDTMLTIMMMYSLLYLQFL